VTPLAMYGRHRASHTSLRCARRRSRTDAACRGARRQARSADATDPPHFSLHASIHTYIHTDTYTHEASKQQSAVRHAVPAASRYIPQPAANSQ
jgi:hypothetical protein